MPTEQEIVVPAGTAVQSAGTLVRFTRLSIQYKGNVSSFYKKNDEWLDVKAAIRTHYYPGLR
jgi:hypothetical protein